MFKIGSVNEGLHRRFDADAVMPPCRVSGRLERSAAVDRPTKIVASTRIRFASVRAVRWR